MHGYMNTGGMNHNPHSNAMNSPLDPSLHHPESTDSYVTYLDNDDSTQESESP